MKILAGLLLYVLLFFASGVLSANKENGGCRSLGKKPYDYSQALCMSFLFFEAQRSGKLPNDKRLDWRGDSALSDGQDNGVDLSGGYYDEIIFVKFGFPQAFITTALSWGLLSYPGGYAAAGQTGYARAAIRWATDYFLKAHTGPNELWVQVGDPETEFKHWGRPEEITFNRPSHKVDENCPGSDVAGETAAALAAASVVFKDVDPPYSSKLLTAAKTLFNFADKFRGKYDDCVASAGIIYKSWNGFGDELAWSALWLYKATKERSYLDKAKGFIKEFQLDVFTELFDWNSKVPGIHALLAELDGSAGYTARFKESIDYVINNRGFYTPKGLIHILEWDPLCRAANLAFLALRAASLGLSDSYYSWAQNQLDYILGSSGRSYIVGFGVNPPQRPKHEASSCPDKPAPCDWDDYNSKEPNPQILFGALVGGPNKNDVFSDDRNDTQKAQVSCFHNALYSGVLAAVIEIEIRSTLCSLVADLEYCSA